MGNGAAETRVLDQQNNYTTRNRCSAQYSVWRYIANGISQELDCFGVCTRYGQLRGLPVAVMHALTAAYCQTADRHCAISQRPNGRILHLGLTAGYGYIGRSAAIFGSNQCSARGDISHLTHLPEMPFHTSSKSISHLMSVKAASGVWNWDTRASGALRIPDEHLAGHEETGQAGQHQGFVQGLEDDPAAVLIASSSGRSPSPSGAAP